MLLKVKKSLTISSAILIPTLHEDKLFLHLKKLMLKISTQFIQNLKTKGMEW